MSARCSSPATTQEPGTRRIRLTPPYETVWNLVGVSDGPVSAKATVPDVAGNSQELPALQFVKDTRSARKAAAIHFADLPGVFTNDTTPEFTWTCCVGRPQRS